MARLEAGRKQPGPAHADPRCPAGPRRPVTRGASTSPRSQGASALLRRSGTFYLVYSAGRCCGRRCNYATGVARSASLLGPWEKRLAPILTGGHGIRCPGHVGIARGPDGQPVLAYHAYVHGDPSNRQLLMSPLSFDAAGWPRVARVRRVVPRPPPERFEFATELSPGWEWPSGPEPVARVAAGRLVLGRGALSRQTGTTRFSARAVVAGRRGAARPALAVMASDGNTVAIELRGSQAVAWRRDDGRLARLGAVRSPRRGRGGAPGRVPLAGATELRLSVGASVRLAVRVGRDWRAVGGPQPLPRWAGGAHLALRVAGPAGARAEFESLSIDPR